MKKCILFTLGLAFVGGSLVIASEAYHYQSSRYTPGSSCGCVFQGTVDPKKRYVSRGCCADRSRDVRPFSDRIGPWQYRSLKSHRFMSRSVSFAHPSLGDTMFFIILSIVNLTMGIAIEKNELIID